MENQKNYLENRLNSSKFQSGFTIAELIGTVAILGMIGGVSYGAYKGISVLNKYLDEPIVERANVTGNDKAELFIEKDGKRFYAEIDGVPVQNYLLNKK